ncbi:MAG: TRAP transporter substrate-binding protein [Pseudodonghicola sp.]
MGAGKFSALALAAAIIGGQAFAADAINLKFAVFTPEQEITYQEAMKPWAEAVEAASGGKLEIEMFPGGILGRDGSKQVKMLKDGVADIAFIIPAYNPGLFPDNWIIELPDTSGTATEGSLTFWRMIESGMLRGYEDLEVLGFVATSPYLMHGTKPMETIDDLKGKKIRIAGKLEQTCVEEVGGVPVGMPISKIPESLTRGIIDATPMHYAALYAFGVSSATDYHYHNHFGSLPFGFVMTKERFAALPEDVQAIMKEKGGEALAKIFGAAMDAENARRLDETRSDSKQHVVDPSAADKAAWSEKMKACSAKFVAEQDNGEALQAAYLKTLEQVRSELGE